MNRIFVYLSLVLLFSTNSHAEIRVGDFPPSYLGKNRAGDDVQLSKMQGKVVVATFWATWCPPCLKEMDVLEGIQRQVGKGKLEIIAINFKEDRKVFRRIKKQLKNFEITLTHDRKGLISSKYGVKSLPHMVIMDKLGKVAKINIGYGDEATNELVDILNELLNAS